MKTVSSDFFNTNEISWDDVPQDKNISSSDFIYEATRKMMQLMGYDLTPGTLDDKTKQAGKMIQDYAKTLKALVKAELLEEMRKGIENINVFYN